MGRARRVARLAPAYAAAAPDELRAVCQQECRSRCCRAAGLVLLRETEARRLSRLASALGVPLNLDRDAAGSFMRYENQAGGRCPFLGEDSLCRIYLKRPNACRAFPTVPGQEGCRLAGWRPAPKVFLATVHGRNIPYEFLAVRDHLIRELMAAGMYGGDEATCSVRVDQNRNMCVDGFLKSKADYLLFVDDDMGFPPGMAARLIAAGKDIVCGLYFQRGTEEVYPHLYRYAGVGPGAYGQRGHMYRPLTEEVREFHKSMPFVDLPGLVEGRDGLIEVDAGGTGCVLIARRVLEALAPPWFQTEGPTNGDLMFFRRAKEAGFGVWADIGIICTHQRYEAVGVGEFLRRHRHEAVGDAPAVNSKEYWDRQHRDEYGRLRTYAGWDEIVQHVARSFADGPLTVADFGCGRSTVHEALHAARADCRIVGLDFAGSAQADNRRRLPADVWLVADVGQAPLASESVELAISNSVVEHLEDPVRLTDEMWRVLKPGGFWLLGVPLDLPHPEHEAVYDWDAVMAMAGRYGSPVWSFPLDGRAVVGVEKPAVVDPAVAVALAEESAA